MSTNKNNSSENQLYALEADLAGTLQRIAPPNEFVQRLRGYIPLPPRREIVLRLQDWRRLFLVFSGVVSGMLVLITVARALYYLFGRRHFG